ncbi:MAG: hypothetical protein IRZ07_03800 [Microbispora sp.]|nr:hypothetical protein [Microbispora sp.]
MNLRNAAGGLSRFAHLAGIVRPKAKAEGGEPEDDDKEKREPEAEEKDEDERKEDARAEDGEDEEKDAEGDEKESEDEDEDEEKKDAKAFAAGRKAERARCAAIFASPEAGLNPAMAAELAFNTSLSAKRAIGVLKAGAVAPSRAGLGARMASTPPIKIGADQASDPPASKAAEAAQLASRTLAAARAAGLKL